jgi:pyridoxamine 5'-phosphate oxidase
LAAAVGVALVLVLLADRVVVVVVDLEPPQAARTEASATPAASARLRVSRGPMTEYCALITSFLVRKKSIFARTHLGTPRADNSRVAKLALELTEDSADRDPLRQLTAWFEDAVAAGVPLPEAAALATATPDGVPAVRMVLVKRREQGGLVFHSSYESRKGRELEENPRAALVFYWEALGRQVRIEGPVERTTPAETSVYVRSRPRGSQLSALASPQSRPIAAREELEQRVAEIAAAHEGAELPLPETWGGFRLVPERLEFWQRRPDRLHDRLLYTRRDDGWTVQRLAP